MPRLIWSPSALSSVQRLYRFLSEKNKPAAQRAIQTIRSGVKILAQHPEAGHPIDGMNVDFREWPIDFGNSGYLALYRYDCENIIILAVRHQKEAGYKNTLS